MKNNFRFIFPRLIGATVLVGLASLILVTIFKLMLGILLIGGVVAMFKGFFGRRNELAGGMYGEYQHRGINPMSNSGHWSERVSVNVNPVQHQTIVPIN
ncbi:hypothetical protein [Dyadobacter psychrotolerans]|uniref:Uncharacterized protein n=1 Tax=Dyadobacter psychrotolerans TaxID=2541721 RepID=A0A4R5DZY6_9BACT|nr:hypothetical protein [Dyadobacter psychrotolerans]TDE18284.1 hypothetical protein E0F88_01720 [Dyadobacter psychrotolerans]